MAAIYIITKTDPDNGTFTVNPNQLNGPGELAQATNLTLFGSGSLRFGQDLNENFIHLLENFASPEQAGLGIPDPAYFNITKAVKGQLWFNSSTSKLMLYDGSAWISAGGTSYGPTAPPSPSNGDLWYDTNAPAQLKLYDGTWTSTADRYVLKAGDTMTGLLTLSGAPTNPLHAATRQYVLDQIGGNNQLPELTDVENDATSAASVGHILYFNGSTWENHLPVLADISNVSASATQVNYLNTATSNIQSQLNLKSPLASPSLTGNPTAPTASPGDNDTTIATTAFVTNGIATATSSIGNQFAEVFVQSGSPGTQDDGDVWIDNVTPKVYIQAANVWRQVWPAQYS